jgi:hypothetical protein
MVARVKTLTRLLPLVCASLLLSPATRAAEVAPTAPLTWPTITQTAKPWAYWWWMASAVDTNNLAKELTRYRDVGMGGVHIIPIYGAKGWETNAIPYLSPKWMDMLAFTVEEANRLGLGVDMTTGSGWCFGGPNVTDADANASVVWKTYQLGVGERITERLDRKSIQAVIAYGPGGKPIDLTSSITADGEVPFSPPGNFVSVPGSKEGPPKTWTIYVVSQKPSGQKVKRAALGGEGHMLNLIYPQAMTNYLRWFGGAFANYHGPKPRAQYHDSYEYRSDWAPDFFAEFEQRRGYRLQDELPALLANASSRIPNPASLPDADRIARVKCDYRETISDLMAEVTIPAWTQWSHAQGFLTRNEAHGSPGNWLDLYAAADIPETEMFYKDRNKLISKFASSAAHVTGKNLVAAETGTWLAEHFTETLADMKYLLDDLFLSGVNHVFYHGTCYSPDEAPWPGWLFYASYEMNPRNPIWRDVSALNAYAAHCQAVLQAGKPDNDILLYWPIHDFWSSTNGLARNMSVHARDWFEEQPVGKTAEWLWKNGYQFDYVSDRQLTQAKAQAGGIEVPGSRYRVVVVPQCQRLPLATLWELLTLADAGATVVFENQFPSGVPGLAYYKVKQDEFTQLLATPTFREATGTGVKLAEFGSGRVLVGSLPKALAMAQVRREAMFDYEGLMCLRRSDAGGRFYFLANRNPQSAFTGWVPLAKAARSVVVMEPMNGESGAADVRQKDGTTEVFLKLAPGESVILRSFDDTAPVRLPWLTQDAAAAQQKAALTGEWQVRFLAGGPELPAPITTTNLASWATIGDTNAQRFAGTALYTLHFDSPGPHWLASPVLLDLGKVAQSARVRLNGQDLGTLFTPPFSTFAGRLKPAGNVLEVEVTSTAANRIRDLDRRGVKWKNFHDINFVNLAYKPFDASNWPLADCGLLGPVTISPAIHRQRDTE